MARRLSFISRLAALASLFVVMAAFPFSSCRHAEETADNTEVLLAVGDSTLTLNDVVSRIPVGVSPADSVALFRSIVDNWVESMVLVDMARNKLPDYDRIERMVDDYRNRLIVARYLKKMSEGKKANVSPDSIRAFYDAHQSEMIAETPLVKGVYVKVADSSPALADIRRCVFGGSGKEIDEFEKKWAADALQYDYFGNDWIDWSVVADEIPYRFYDPDAFLESTSNFETSCNGSTYLLHIYAWLPSGSQLPLEFASSRIGAILEQAKLASYEDALVRSLVKKAIADEKLVVYGYDPVTHRNIPGAVFKKENESEK